MNQLNPLFAITYPCGARRYRLVSGAWPLDEVEEPGDEVIGVVIAHTGSGSVICTMGIAPVLAGANFTRGELAYASFGGTIGKCPRRDDYDQATVVGIVLENAREGEIVPVLLFPSMREVPII